MSEMPSGRRDVVTWRTCVMVSFCIIGALLVGVLNRIEKTADLASNLATLVGAMNSRLDAQAERITSHDRRFEFIEGRLFPTRAGTP